MTKIYDGYPRHHQQPEPYGCQYYAFLSLTGCDLTEHALDASEQRMQIRLFSEGYLMFPIYANTFEPACAEWWWRTIGRYNFGPGAWAPLLVTIDSLKYDDVRHMVAVQVADKIRVFDPGAENVKVFDLESFIDSPYSQAWEVFHVQSASLVDNPFVDSRELPHVKASPPAPGESNHG